MITKLKAALATMQSIQTVSDYWDVFKEIEDLRTVIEQLEASEPVAYTYASTQATQCAQCGERKHTPLRIDAMGGYVCLTCIDKKLGSLLGEFGYPAPVQPKAEPLQPKVTDKWESARVADYNSGWNDCLFASGIEREAAPQARKPLTDEHIHGILESVCEDGSAPAFDSYMADVDAAALREFARAIEAAHGIGKGDAG